MQIKYQVPNIYRNLLPKDILQFDLTETKATCGACPVYANDLKCCTFYPYLPNYTIGALLTQSGQGTASALEAIRTKIKNREYSLPLGLVAPPNYQVPFQQRQKNEFGWREDWLCPYFDRVQKNCGIWRWRGSVCTGFFCKSSFGVAGLRFWDELSNYMTYVEMALMEEALVMMDFSPRQIGDLLGYLNRKTATKTELRSARLPEKKAKALWNGYYEDQESFFKKTFQIVSELDRKSYRDLIGEPGQRLEDNLRKVFERICPQ